jgi:hypothetical protein
LVTAGHGEFIELKLLETLRFLAPSGKTGLLEPLDELTIPPHLDKDAALLFGLADALLHSDPELFAELFLRPAQRPRALAVGD